MARRTRRAPKGGLKPRKKKKNPWSLKKQQKKSGLFVSYLYEVEKLLPGSTGAEKKEWVKDRIDDLINLPPFAEEISDFFIEVGVEIAYAATQAAKRQYVPKEDYIKIESKYNALRDQYADLYARWQEAVGETP